MSVSDATTRALADRAGIARYWEDAFGAPHEVALDDLRAVLAALGVSAGSEASARDDLHALDARSVALPPLLTGEAGGRLAVPLPAGRFSLSDEAGAVVPGQADTEGAGASLPLPEQPGFYRLALGDRETMVAVAPARCFTVADALADAGRPGRRAWGLAQQLYALRRPGDGGVGDFQALAEFVREAASHGAAAVSISPVHAQFSADPDRFSPYAPSSRIMLNVLHIAAEDPGEEAARLEALDLVDWPSVGRDRLARLRRRFEAGGREEAGFAAWRATEGDKLESHAVFEALHAHLWRGQGLGWNWRDWPAAFRDPRSAEVAAFTGSHADKIAFHAWLQFRADRGLQAAQAAARQSGMPIGLVSDLAVGTDSGGSHCWSRQQESLVGLTVGAPPDLLQKHGQNWGITAFSALGLRESGYRAFLEMVSGAMRHAGGVRIDHAMGLNRLWVVPEGRSAAHGAYLRMPETDLMRLLRLESHRNRAIVLGEDLGTVPDGFQGRLEQAGIDGMRVLWFEKEGDRFVPPERWSRQASAMTSTHDLPTVAGWWKGIDIGHQRALGGTEADEQRALGDRRADRTALWSAFVSAGTAQGPEPAAWDAFPVVDAAIAQVGDSACELAMIPTEDAVALDQQPNIPGTVHEHPNWRRRLEQPVGQVLSGERTMLRLARLDEARRG